MSDASNSQKFDEVSGRALRVGDRLLWARRDFIIRGIVPGADGVAWLTLAEMKIGLIQENAMELPVILQGGNYHRLRW